MRCLVISAQWQWAPRVHIGLKTAAIAYIEDALPAPDPDYRLVRVRLTEGTGAHSKSSSYMAVHRVHYAFCP